MTTRRSALRRKDIESMTHTTRGCLKMTCAHTTSTPATAFVKQRRSPTLSRERYNSPKCTRVSSALFCGLFLLHKIRAQKKNTLKFIMVRLSRRVPPSRFLSLSKLLLVRNERTNLVRARIGEKEVNARSRIHTFCFSLFLLRVEICAVSVVSHT